MPLPSGRWLRARPKVAGVYRARYKPDERWFVAYFDPANDCVAASTRVSIDIPWSVADPDWYYSDGDVRGYPTRADFTA